MGRSTLSFVLAVVLAVLSWATPLWTTPAAATTTLTPLPLTIKENAGIARLNEVLTSGVPVPRTWNLLNTKVLAVVDVGGNPVPAEFQITARWNAGLADTTQPAQWLLVSFAANVGANGTAQYHVIADGSAGTNPAPTVPLHLSRSGNQITVSTGAAVFRLGGNANALFDEIRLPDGTMVVKGETLSGRIDGVATQHAALRRLRIEHTGPLTAKGTVALALNHMHRYEPQALRVLNPTMVAVDIADEKAWLGQRQGLFANFAVGAFADLPSRPTLDRVVWSALNHPLHALASAAWTDATQAVGELPHTVLTAPWARYDQLVPAVLNRTLQKIDAKGLAGLMTFGLYPRYWGTDIYGDELNCSGNDPTPTAHWDDTYWCATWTDYHNTTAAVTKWALQSGESGWLDELAFPAAQRMLFTQIMQCGPNDSYFYCGQAPAGYGGYREDFNSSHAYFDNLILYYWLTGDSTVVDTLKRGAASMRIYLCTRRPAAPCLATDPPTDPWAGLAGRSTSQWNAAFRFIGLTSSDASYLDDWKSDLARALTQYYVEGLQKGIAYGFWMEDVPYHGAAKYSTSQLWMTSLYDMNQLYRLVVETDNAALGVPAITPMRAIEGWARTLTRFGATVSGNGTAAGRWPNALSFTNSGARLGGRLLQVSPDTSGSDPYLYADGKAALTTVLLRAGASAKAANLTTMGRAMTDLALTSAILDGSPLGKFMGEYLTPLPAAIARLSGAEP